MRSIKLIILQFNKRDLTCNKLYEISIHLTERRWSNDGEI